MKIENITPKKKKKNPIPSGIKAKPFRWEDSLYTEAAYIVNNKDHFPMRRIRESYNFLEID